MTWLERSVTISALQGSLLFIGLVGGVVYWTGFAWVQNQSDLPKWIGSNSVIVTGTIIQPVRRIPDRQVMVTAVSSVTKDTLQLPASGNILLTWRNPDSSVSQGNHIEASVRLRPPYGTLNPGGFHYGTYLQWKGIQAVATVSGPGKIKRLDSPSTSWWAKIRTSVDQWRHQVQQAAMRNLSDPALGLFLGMIIGEQGWISQEAREAFMTTGTVHIISISGSHLGLIAFLTFFVVRGLILHLPVPWLEWLSLRMTATRLAVLVTFPLVSFYTLLAGAETATVRSWIMIAFFLLAVWVGRERNLLRVLALAAVVVLVHNPQALYDISFQLSYVSVLAMALMIQAIQRRTQEVEEHHEDRSPTAWRLWRWITHTWWISLAVILATLPLVAYHFNQIAWVGLLANLMVVPYVGFVVVPLGLMSAVWVLLTGAESLPLGLVNQTALEGLVKVVRIFASLPGAEWHVASPAVLTMLIFYGFFMLSICLNRPRLRLNCACGLVVILIVWIWSPRFGWDSDSLRVTFLDVGQGDATVIELPDGQTVLIDGGPAYSRLDMGSAVIGPYLWDHGIRRLDHVIATHPQWDHVGGLPWVIKTFDVGHYWSNGVARDKAFYHRIQQAIEEAGLQKHIASQGEEITKAGPCHIEVLNPPSSDKPLQNVRTSSQSGSDLNNLSIITKLDCGKHSFLFTADAELEALWRLNQLVDARSARIVKIPHHGAKSSFNRQWINGLQAEAAVVSVGQHNRYGHPVREVVEAYEEKGIPVYRTDRDGAVWITASLQSSELRIVSAKQQQLVPVRVDSQIWKVEWENWGKILEG